MLRSCSQIGTSVSGARGLAHSSAQPGARAVGFLRTALGSLAVVGLLGQVLAGCSSPSADDLLEPGGAAAPGEAVPGASAGPGVPDGTASNAAPAPSSPAELAGSPAVQVSEGTPAPALEPNSPEPGSAAPANTAPAGDPSVESPAEPPSAPVAPPVSDTASALPVARQRGFTTDANIIYGPLPEQRLDVLYPPTAGPNGTEKLPAVVMFHGGGWIQGDKATMASFYSRFLAHGFIVATVEYRVANQGIAPAAVQDALLAAKWVWDHADYYNIDTSKYIVTGASAGGHLALMVGMATAESNLGPTAPNDFKLAAIVNGYGPADVNDMLQRRIGFAVSWLPDNTPDHDALATRLSPVTYVRQDMPPLLTVQGSQDTTVPVAEGQALHAKLLAAGADAEHHLVAGAGHGFTTPASAWPDAEQTIFGFLVKHGIGK